MGGDQQRRRGPPQSSGSWLRENVHLVRGRWSGSTSEEEIGRQWQAHPMDCLTWDSGMMWLASSWMGKDTPSSEENEDIGERVPEVRMTERAQVSSVKAFE